MGIRFDKFTAYRINPISLPPYVQRVVWNGERDYEFVYLIIPNEYNPDKCFLILTLLDITQDDWTVEYVESYIRTGVICNLEVVKPKHDLLVSMLADLVK